MNAGSRLGRAGGSFWLQAFRKVRSFPATRVLIFLLATAVAALVGCASNKDSETAAPRGYMRVAQPDKDTVALQIAWRKFSPGKGRGPTIWLAGASHLGDSNYFARLQKLLDVQSLVLFEGVGAGSKKMKFNPDEETSIQHTMATSLGLVFQLSAIDYDRPHYTNSDLTIPQLQALLSGDAGGGTLSSPGRGSKRSVMKPRSLQRAGSHPSTGCGGGLGLDRRSNIPASS